MFGRSNVGSSDRRSRTTSNRHCVATCEPVERRVLLSATGLIFVTNTGNGTVGEYTTSGKTVNASLISGLSNPSAIAVSG
jgi:hypothetical protein